MYLCLSVSVSVSVYVSVSVHVHPLTFIYREAEAEGEMARPARTLPAAGSQPIDRNNALQMYGCVVVFCVRARTSSACCPTQVVHAFKIPKRNHNKIFIAFLKSK